MKVKFKTLNEWLTWIQSNHVTEMDLSLERVLSVAERLQLFNPSYTIITVGGTNGKGSCVAGLEAIYLTAGYRVGAFTSPILFKHNEYIRIQGDSISDAAFCAAFERIEEVRGEITLTLFEFNTLAALLVFENSNLDIGILEVGLGGRFDAVNVMDADIAIVASIGIDHVEWLGDTREKIGFEKAGIFRKNKPAICGDVDPPKSLMEYAEKIGAPFFSQNQQFGFEKSSSGWNWWNQTKKIENLPLSKLALQNLSTVLMATTFLEKKFPVSLEIIKTAFEKVNLPGRIQVFSGKITKIFDVSHNPAAAEFLANWLRENGDRHCEHDCLVRSNPKRTTTRAVFSMLGDKDILGTLNVMKNVIDEWYIAPLTTKRAASLEKLSEAFSKANISRVFSCFSVSDAYEMAQQNSKENDRIVVFGSFHTVSEVSRMEASETFASIL